MLKSVFVMFQYASGCARSPVGKSALIILTLALGANESASAAIRRVDGSTTTTGPGTSWGNAYSSLTDALAASSSGDVLWVADYTYKPVSQASSFSIPAGVTVLGGFQGNETTENERNLDPATNGCILSGDISNNDGANFANYSDACYHVVSTASNIDNDTVLESVTIRGGNANNSGDEDSGGGMFIISGRPKVRYCRIIENRAENYGGGVWTKGAGTDDDVAIFRDCEISNNYAVNQGGGIVTSPDTHLVNCRLENNSTGGSGTGGAIVAGASGDVNIYNCEIVGNSASGGGGAYCSGSHFVRFVNTLMHDNTSSGVGGAISVGTGLQLIVADSTITDNSAASGGGALYLGSGLTNSTITNSILWNNESTSGNDEIELSGSTVAVTYSDVEGGYTGTGNIDSDPDFVGGGD